MLARSSRVGPVSKRPRVPGAEVPADDGVVASVFCNRPEASARRRAAALPVVRQSGRGANATAPGRDAAAGGHRVVKRASGHRSAEPVDLAPGTSWTTRPVEGGLPGAGHGEGRGDRPDENMVGTPKRCSSAQVTWGGPEDPPATNRFGQRSALVVRNTSAHWRSVHFPSISSTSAAFRPPQRYTPL